MFKCNHISEINSTMENSNSKQQQPMDVDDMNAESSDGPQSVSIVGNTSEI